ncbi:MAG: DUF3108 domain-containing protein [Alcanivorax sp.]|nr:DUF3108 domain-containing protein [Alcanivorax sp.]
MASLYPSKATGWTSVLALLAMMLSRPVLADPAPVPPFSDHYRLKSQGIPFTIEATRTLRRVRDGLWEMNVHAKNWLGEIRETALFSWQDCMPETSFYGYRRRGLGRVKKAEVHINRDTGVAVSERSNKPMTSYEVGSNATDDLSLTLALQCRLRQGANDITLDVADDRGLSTHHYRVVGKEKLDIDHMAVNTVKVKRVRAADSKRQTFLWFAPGRDYALVKLEQQNADGKHTMTLMDEN